MKNYYDPEWAEKVTLTVKRIEGKWEFFYGGDVPVKDGTIAEITLNASDISDARFKQRVTQEFLFQILKEGTELLVALSGPDGTKQVGFPTPRPVSTPAGTMRFAKVVLGPPRPPKPSPQQPLNIGEPEGGLWLKLKGLERSELMTGQVFLPEEFDGKVAISLNHAFTLLSERYETHRLAHTGNVYQRVFYQDKDEQWYPIDDLRKGVKATAERQLLASAWQAVEQQLGWRPITPQSKAAKPAKKQTKDK